MADVQPLRGVRYDANRIGDLASVIAPPYDVISPAEQAALYDRSPWNVVRLILPRESDRGAAAAAALREWMDGGVLAQDDVPSLYVYAQTFTLADGRTFTRNGVLCRLGLEEFSRGVVRPHERTFPGPKADRLALMRATGAYLSPIFGMYARPGERLRDLAGATGSPLVDVTTPDGHRHRLWRIVDPAAIARVHTALAGETVFIADGHHRYETGLAYRQERGGAGGSSHILAYLANMEEEGLVILPTHRLVRERLALSSAELQAKLATCFALEPLSRTPRPERAIDVVLPDGGWRLRPRPEASACLADLPPVVRSLDVAILHGAILRPVLGIGSDGLEFTHDDDEAYAAVRDGRAGAAFLVNPPTMAEVRAVCLAGELMPEKSTYFFPKVADGLVFDLVGPPWIC